MQTPDEVAHYWRAQAVARGQLFPERVDGRPSMLIPADARDLVFHTWMEMAGKDVRYETERFQRARTLRPTKETVRLSFPAFYTFVPHLPQALAIAVTRLMNVPTLYSFYVGRLANALAGVLLVLLAMRLAPNAAWIFGAVGLTPMFLYLCGSYSADVVTIGVAFCTIAAGLRGSIKALAVFAPLLTLAKPAYFLISMIAVTVRKKATLIVLALVLAGVIVAAWTTKQAYYPMRPDVATDAPQQLEHVKRAPFRFIALSANDYATNGDAYYEQFTGRLGWLDIGLPRVLRWLFGVLFLYVVATAAVELGIGKRLLFLALFLGTLLVISLSQYLIWTAVGAGEIHGIQGRYFLPVAPLLLLALSSRAKSRDPLQTERRSWYRGGCLDFARHDRFHPAVPVGIGAIANVVALATLARHYYGTFPPL